MSTVWTGGPPSLLTKWFCSRPWFSSQFLSQWSPAATTPPPPPPSPPPITGKHKFFNQEFEASLKRRTAVNQPRHEHTPNLFRQPATLLQFNLLWLKIVPLNPFLVSWSFSWCSLGATGPTYFVFCRLYSSSPSHHSSVWLITVISLLLPNTVSPVRTCLSIWLERFRGSQKKAQRVPLSMIIIPLW
jgi:hypothetical protein